MYCKNQRGFTVIEFVIVVMVIGLVVIILTPVVTKKRISVEKMRVDNVMRIFMHERDYFSFMIEKDNPEIEIVTYRALDVRIIRDVPRDKKGWLDLEKCRGALDSWPGRADLSCKKMEIHIHSEKEVEGGEWNHGKGGRGVTQVIE